MANKIVLSYLFQILSAILIVIRLLFLTLTDNLDYLGFYSLMISFLLLSSFFSQFVVNNSQIQKIIIQKNIDIKYFLPITLIINLIIFNLIFIFSSFSLELYIKLFLCIVSISIYFIVDLLAIVKDNLNLLFRNVFFQNIISTITIIFISYNKIDIISLSYVPIFAFILPVIFSKEIYNHLEFKNILKGFKDIIQLFKGNIHLSIVPPINLAVDYILKYFISARFGIHFLGDFQTIQSMESLTGNVLLGPYYKSLFLDSIKTKFKRLRTIVTEVFIITIVPIVFLIIIKSFDFIFLDKLNRIFGIIILVLSAKFIFNVWGAICQILIAKGNHILITKIEILNKLSLMFAFFGLSYFFDERLLIYPNAIFLSSLILIIIILILKINYSWKY